MRWIHRGSKCVSNGYSAHCNPATNAAVNVAANTSQAPTRSARSGGLGVRACIKKMQRVASASMPPNVSMSIHEATSRIAQVRPNDEDPSRQSASTVPGSNMIAATTAGQSQRHGWILSRNSCCGRAPAMAARPIPEMATRSMLDANLASVSDEAAPYARPMVESMSALCCQSSSRQSTGKRKRLRVWRASNHSPLFAWSAPDKTRVAAVPPKISTGNRAIRLRTPQRCSASMQTKSKATGIAMSG